jgi:hypothetical protein
MNRLAALALLPALLLAGCSDSGDSGDEGSKKASGDSCEGKLTAADPAAKLPAGIPDLEGQVLYEPSTQGKTTIVFGRVAKSDFVAVRDELKEKLARAGWTIDGTDQESVEAEVQFSKTPPLMTGSVKVQPLCDGNVSIRYRVSS